MMLSAACVLKSGGIYDAFHVTRLRLAVARHLKVPYRFVCLSDIDLDCETIPLVTDWPGWWAKVELFRPGLFRGRVLYLDLDVTVVGDLEPLASFPHPFAAIADYQFPLQLNSSVMAWDAGPHDHLFTDMTPATMARLHGDQNWIFERVKYQARFPRRWCPSYRWQVRKMGLDSDARVVVWHGRPKPWDVSATEFLGEKIA